MALESRHGAQWTRGQESVPNQSQQGSHPEASSEDYKDIVQKLMFIKKFKIAANRPVYVSRGSSGGNSRAPSMNNWSTGSTGASTKWIQPSGPRRPGEGTENEEQGIVGAERQPDGAAMLQITLLAAGFVIGPSGASVREIMRQTMSDIKSWTDSTSLTSRRPCRTFVIEGEDSAVGHAIDLITAAVDRYKELCEGRCQGQSVSRQQYVMGVEFSYQPPPRNVVPFAASLKGHVGRPGKPTPPAYEDSQYFQRSQMHPSSVGMLPTNPGFMPMMPGSGYVMPPFYSPDSPAVHPQMPPTMPQACAYAPYLPALQSPTRPQRGDSGSTVPPATLGSMCEADNIMNLIAPPSPIAAYPQPYSSLPLMSPRLGCSMYGSYDPSSMMAYMNLMGSPRRRQAAHAKETPKAKRSSPQEQRAKDDIGLSLPSPSTLLGLIQPPSPPGYVMPGTQTPMYPPGFFPPVVWYPPSPMHTSPAGPVPQNQMSANYNAPYPNAAFAQYGLLEEQSMRRKQDGSAFGLSTQPNQQTTFSNGLGAPISPSRLNPLARPWADPRFAGSMEARKYDPLKAHLAIDRVTDARTARHHRQPSAEELLGMNNISLGSSTVAAPSSIYTDKGKSEGGESMNDVNSMVFLDHGRLRDQDQCEVSSGLKRDQSEKSPLSEGVVPVRDDNQMDQGLAGVASCQQNNLSARGQGELSFLRLGKTPRKPSVPASRIRSEEALAAAEQQHVLDISPAGDKPYTGARKRLDLSSIAVENRGHSDDTPGMESQSLVSAMDPLVSPGRFKNMNRPRSVPDYSELAQR